MILRSSDGAESRMHKLDPSRASPVFESMLSLPQPTDERAVDRSRDGLPVVRMTETAAVLEAVLRFCVPGPPPGLSNLACSISPRDITSGKLHELGMYLEKLGQAVQDTQATQEYMLGPSM